MLEHEEEDTFADEMFHGDDDDDEAPIALSIRQPSYASLSDLIPKGSSDPVQHEATEPGDDSDPVIVLTKEEDEPTLTLSVRQSSYANMRLTTELSPRRSQNDSSDGGEEEDTFGDPVIVLTDDKEKPGDNISLSMRQPSFLSLQGPLITKSLYTVKSQSNFNLSKQDKGFIEELRARNEDRWKSIGYEPEEQQPTQKTLASKSFYIQQRSNPSQQTPPLFQVFGEVKRKRPGSAGSKLEREMNGLSARTMSDNDLLGNVINEDSDRENHSVQSGLPSNYRLDLSQLRDTQGYDSEQGSSHIPPLLREIIVHPKESVVYLSLCGVDVSGYKRSVVDETMSQLNYYENECIDRGYISEAEYVQTIIDELKENQAELAATNGYVSTDEVDEQITRQCDEISRIERIYENKESRIDAEMELAISELNARHEENLEAVDEKWSSPAQMKKFNKPSPKLIELRQSAKRLLKARRFDEARMVSRDIEAQEKLEAEEASQRMQRAYEVAISQEERKRDNDEETLIESFNTKRRYLSREKESRLLPIKNRLQTLQNKRANIADIARNSAARKSTTTTRPKTTAMGNRTVQLGASAPLALPPLVMRRRGNESRLSSSIQSRGSSTRRSEAILAS